MRNFDTRTEKKEQEARVERQSDPALYSCTPLNGSTHSFAGERCSLQAGTLLLLDSAPALTPFVRHSRLLIRWPARSCRRGKRDTVLYFFCTRRPRGYFKMSQPHSALFTSDCHSQCPKELDRSFSGVALCGLAPPEREIAG